MLHYMRMPDPVYADTLKPGIVSKWEINYVQAYYTSYGWSLCHCMAHKSEAHDMLSLMLKRDGVPPNMIVNKSKEQYLGSFELKFRSSECQLVNSKTYLHWSKID